MKTLIIYQSVHHKNTEKVAKVMAKILGALLLKPNQVDIQTLNHYDLIGFGSGIYIGKPHKTIIELINKLPEQKNFPAFVFSTSGRGNIAEHSYLKRKLLDKGFKIVAEFACKGWDTFGPFAFFGGLNKGRPNKEDLEKAKNFAQSLIN